MSAPPRSLERVARTGPVVVAAPSGTGKTTVCRQVVERDGGIVFSVSHTTRPRRPAERDGVDYHFVDESEFRRLAQSGAFLEWAVYNGNHYGTSFSSIDAPLADGLDVLLEIEVQGARQVRERRPDACFIFLLPPSFETLRERLTGRGTDAPEEVERRLRVAAKELSAAPDFDYAVINQDLDVCVADVLAILAAERIRDTAALRERFDPRRSADALARSAGSADGMG
jgi:guanylate kinase